VSMIGMKRALVKAIDAAPNAKARASLRFMPALYHSPVALRRMRNRGL
jgi:hypothetical protein